MASSSLGVSQTLVCAIIKEPFVLLFSECVERFLIGKVYYFYKNICLNFKELLSHIGLDQCNILNLI